MASKTTGHVHEFRKGRSGSVETCFCGKFRFTQEYLATHPSIVETPVWTVERVKEELPDVHVLDERDGKVYGAFVKGRLNEYATVQIYGKPWFGQWSWQTIADCLNRCVPLRA